jgi:hypothetical protein
MAGRKAPLATARTALLSGDDQHEPAESSPRSRRSKPSGPITRRGRAAVCGWVVGPTGGRGFDAPHRRSSRCGLPPGDGATNGFRIFKADILRDPRIDLDQEWLTSYDLEPYVLYKAIRGGYKTIEVPCTVRYHAKEGYTKMRGIRDWWRLFRPAILLRTGVKR